MIKKIVFSISAFSLSVFGMEGQWLRGPQKASDERGASGLEKQERGKGCFSEAWLKYFSNTIKMLCEDGCLGVDEPIILFCDKKTLELIQVLFEEIVGHIKQEAKVMMPYDKILWSPTQQCFTLSNLWCFVDTLLAPYHKGQVKDLLLALHALESPDLESVVARVYVKKLKNDNVIKQYEDLESFINSSELPPAAASLLKEGRGLQIWEARALSGDAEAQYQLGLLYEQLTSIPHSRRESLNWYKKAAEGDHAEAAYCVGSFYEDKLDFAKALQLYQSAAEKGHEEAMRRMVFMNQDSMKPKMYTWFKGLAKKEETRLAAEMSLGLFWYYNETNLNHYKLARNHFEIAAKGGHPQAQNMLGIMHYQGIGGSKNSDKAKKWFEIAAAQGDGDAQRNLSSYYTKNIKGGHPEAPILSSISIGTVNDAQNNACDKRDEKRCGKSHKDNA